MQLMPTAAHRKLTYADFVRFPADGRRHELIDGVHYVTPSPATVHQRLVGELYFRLRDYLRVHPIGEVLLSPLDVRLSNHDIVEPDLMVVLREQQEIVAELHLVGAPAIVIEILSPGTKRRDDGAKRELYAKKGVREYWLVDPKNRTIRRYTRGRRGAFVALPTLGAGAHDALDTPLLPGLTLDVAALFPITSSPRVDRRRRRPRNG